jgi:hypothetical protein
VLVDPLDRVPVELKFAENDGREVDATAAQLVESHWLLTAAPQPLKHPWL